MSRWRALRSRLAGAAFCAGLALFVWLSVQVYRSKTDPESFHAWDGPQAWIVGPPADALEAAAGEHLEIGMAALNDRELPDAERLRVYRERLARAEALLVRSLRAQPAQARVLAALAAVRWELDPPREPAAIEKHRELIALASRMAPTYPRVQKQIGELLLKMGRRDEARDYLGRAVTLDPAYAREVTGVMTDYGFSADEVLHAMPRQPEVLVWLERPFFEDARQDDYLVLLDEALAHEAVPALLERYGSTSLRLGRAEELAARMSRFGELADPAAEAERLAQRSHALLVLGRFAAALEDAAAAERLEPAETQRAEQLGDVALRAGDTERAVAAFRTALGLAAKGKEAPTTRARLYRKIGETEEVRGKPDLAYDAYRRTLELSPDDARARRRIETMEQAAGF